MCSAKRVNHGSQLRTGNLTDLTMIVGLSAATVDGRMAHPESRLCATHSIPSSNFRLAIAGDVSCSGLLRDLGSQNQVHTERHPTRHAVRMPYIQQVSDADATGDAKRELDLSAKRAGRVWNIVRIMTPNPAVLRASMQLYKAIMYGESPLSRAQREMLAVVVSRQNDCVY